MNDLQIQIKLRKWGYYVGALDGIKGAKTDEAIVRFKRKIGLRARPYVGDITKKELRVYDNPMIMESDPLWLRHAITYIGEREIKGWKHNANIVSWWKEIHASFRDDETPWCAAFVGAMLERCGVRSTRSAMARSYMTLGKPAEGAVRGSVCVLWRGKRSGYSGHVFFCLGTDRAGNIIGIGGNQADAVNIRAFSPDRLLGFRLPEHHWSNDDNSLRLATLNHRGKLSVNEA